MPRYSPAPRLLTSPWLRHALMLAVAFYLGVEYASVGSHKTKAAHLSTQDAPAAVVPAGPTEAEIEQRVTEEVEARLAEEVERVKAELEKAAPGTPPAPTGHQPVHVEGVPPPKGRYLVPMQVLEGWGAYPDGIHEMFQLARRLNRWLVEPCVRSACVEPCRCGQIREPPPFDQAAYDRGEDPFDLPELGVPCKLYHEVARGARSADAPEPSYPLRAYMDVEHLKATFWPYVIPYNEFCAEYSKTAVVDETTKRWKEEKAYCYAFGEEHCKWDGKPIGDFVFSSNVHARKRTPLDGLELLYNDPSPAIFVHNYYRQYFGLSYEYPAVPAPGHVAAVKAWAKAKFGDAKWAAFHWRHEFADLESLDWCARTLLGAAQVLPQVNPSIKLAALNVDMPPPGRNHTMWSDNDYKRDEAGALKLQAARSNAVQVMMDGGMHVYDAEHLDTDAGILGIRDYLVGLLADAYVTCSGNNGGPDCRKCFKPGSNYLFRIVKDRTLAGKQSTEYWMDGEKVKELGKATGLLPGRL